MSSSFLLMNSRRYSSSIFARSWSSSRAFSTHGVEDRERALENAAVRKKDAELLDQLAKKLPQKPARRVAVVGAGLMGTGIAQVTAQAGIDVTLIDVNQQVLDAGLKRISGSIARVAKKTQPDAAKAEAFSEAVLTRIKTTSKLDEGVKDAYLVIEAIVENLKAKWELFSAVEKAAPSDAVLATNTSSLRVSSICSAVGDASRVGGLHFFNPVPVMKLVEVVSSKQTAPETTKTLIEFGEKIGKTVVTCGDTPGFIVNRLLVPFMAEAMRMLERGDASLVDIDTAMKLGAAHPMGPMQLADYVGLDTSMHIMDGWQEDYPREPLFKTPAVLTALVRAGHLGDKIGSGFYVKGQPNPFLLEYLKKKK